MALQMAVSAVVWLP